MMRRHAMLALGAFGLALSACAKTEDVIVHTGQGKEKTTQQIDSDPLALLPGGAITVGVLDMEALFASQFGDKLLAVTKRRAPVPEAAGYDPKRDLKKAYFGTYSMQGADVSGVAIGNFDPQKIEAAADGVQKTPLGVPVTKTTYAGRALYTADSVGFTILTTRTALFGNQTGIRRALDRIKDGTATRELPPWASKVLAQSGAPFAFGSNLKENPVPNALRSKLPFLDGVETLSVVGNFAAPGVNLAGTLVYPDEAAAKTGAGKVAETRSMLDTYTPFLALLGIPQPVRKLEADAVGREGHFVAGIDAVAFSALLSRLDDLLGALPKAQPSAVSQ
ncbi:MAG TPA: hypothetical protein VEQ59_10980 [Polyangiaceae bacterium]|nr:hypothetical protein [Polyangiaceae bacterium]